MVKRTNPKLWERSKQRAKREMGGKHSARAMQRAVQLYKEEGGRYEGPKPSASKNSLVRWTQQDWDYANGRGSRYLPKRVREQLTEDERRRTNEAKRRSTRSGKQYSRQPEDVAKKTSRILQRGRT